MQTTSSAFDTAINLSSRELHDKLTIQTADLETYNLTSDDIIAGSLKVNRSCFLDGFELGTCFAADMSVSLKNSNGEWEGIDLEGATVWPYSGIRLPDTTIEYILLGTFIIDEPGRPDAELSIKAVDRLVLLDRPFSGVSISWPATNYQILQAISTHCSVPLATSVSSALHMSYSVTAAPEGDYSCRDIVEQICLMAAGFCRMSRIGELEIGTLPDLTGETFDVNLTTANRFAFRQTSEPVTITGMTYKDIQETVQLGTEEYSLQIETLGILQANRDAVLAAIWSEISGYTYVGFESEYPGNPAIDVGDSIYQLTKDEREIVSLISGHSFVHGGSCVLSAIMKPKLAVDWAAKNTKRLTAIAQKLDTAVNTLTSFQQASAQMSDLLTIGLGLYRTEEVLEDGSIIQYMHNLPLLSESDIIWKQTALAWAYSTDGGDTWLGYDVNGNMVAKILSIVGLNADWINAGKISAALIELLVTSGNLVENSKFAVVSSNESLFTKQLNLIGDYTVKTVMQGWCIAFDQNAGFGGSGTYMTDYGWFHSYKTPQSWSYDPAEMVSTPIACQVGEVYVLSYYGETGYQFNDLGADTYGLMLGLEFDAGAYTYYAPYNVFRAPIITGDAVHARASSVEALEPPFYLEAYDENDDFYWYHYTTFTPTRYSVKFTMPDKTFVKSGTTHAFTGNVCLYLKDRRGSSLSFTLVGKIQLEKSEFITPYSPKNGEFVPEGISFTSNGMIVREGSTLQIPTPTEDNHAANKQYVDDRYAVVDITLPSNQNDTSYTLPTGYTASNSVAIEIVATFSGSQYYLVAGGYGVSMMPGLYKLLGTTFYGCSAKAILFRYA